MTREYFNSNVNSWEELLEVCSDYGCHICCENIIYKDDLDGNIEYDIANSGYGWRDIRDCLEEIEDGHDYYIYNGRLEYEVAEDSDFEYFKGEVEDWMDDNDYWEPADEEDNCEQPAEPPIEDEDFSVPYLIDMCGTKFFNICEYEKIIKEQENIPIEFLLKNKP